MMKHPYIIPYISQKEKNPGSYTLYIHCFNSCNAPYLKFDLLVISVVIIVNIWKLGMGIKRDNLIMVICHQLSYLIIGREFVVS